LQENKEGSKKSFLQTVIAVGGIETVFYLPNHFRQTVLVNSNRISFHKSSDALLELMNYMFKLNDKTKPIKEFKFSNFMACYQNFFKSTLYYETIFLTSRLQIYDSLKDTTGSTVAGISGGMIG
jgi:hypothetical protein